MNDNVNEITDKFIRAFVEWEKYNNQWKNLTNQDQNAEENAEIPSTSINEELHVVLENLERCSKEMADLLKRYRECLPETNTKT